MLKHLWIQNIAIAEKIEIEFSQGLNIITGETGAGKSILIDALMLLHGKKPDVSLIRNQCDEAVVAALFQMHSHSILKQILSGHGLLSEDHGEEILVRRIVNRSGKHRAFINDIPVTAKILQEVFPEIIDVCSQFESQRLLERVYHYRYLDRYAKCEEIYEQYAYARNQTLQLLAKLDKVKKDLLFWKREHSLMEFEWKEIEDLKPDADELEKLQRILNVNEKSFHVQKLCSDIEETLANAHDSVFARVTFCKKTIEKIQKISEKIIDKETVDLNNITDNFNAITVHVDDILNGISKVCSSFDIDPDLVTEAGQRIEKYNRILSKYGPTLTEVFEHHKKCESFLKDSGKFESQEHQFTQECLCKMQETIQLSLKLSEKRKNALPHIKVAVERHLEQLGMNQTRFFIHTQRHPRPIQMPDWMVTSQLSQLWEQFSLLTQEGFESVEFLMSTNPGEEPHSLDKIMSGGELSRTLLALKSILSQEQSVSVFVFDEIDAGISGHIAARVGRKLFEFCQNQQAIVVTHLPQVACFAARHHLVSKANVHHRTVLQVKVADESERIHELAILLSGEKVTQEGKAQAKVLLKEAQRTAVGL